MVRFLFKVGLYLALILIVLECLVRVFHLYNDRPERFVDRDNLNKWRPEQTGYSVYGNRRQVFSRYRINASGFNSAKEYNPTFEGREVALIGDSFIEGFHQDYTNSLGVKIENGLSPEQISIYEYGHSSNDLADELYLVYKNKDKFAKVDYFIYHLRYDEDLIRSEYRYIRRVPSFKPLRKSKLFVYISDIGLLDPFRDLTRGLSSLKRRTDSTSNIKPKVDLDSLYISNFKSLIGKYNFQKEKSAFLLDSRSTHPDFIQFLEDNGFSYIDFAPTFESAEQPTTLIFDQHWNDYGRDLVADLIKEHLKSRMGSKEKE